MHWSILRFFFVFFQTSGKENVHNIFEVFICICRFKLQCISFAVVFSSALWGTDGFCHYNSIIFKRICDDLLVSQFITQHSYNSVTMAKNETHLFSVVPLVFRQQSPKAKSGSWRHLNSPLECYLLTPSFISTANIKNASKKDFLLRCFSFSFRQGNM